MKYNLLSYAMTLTPSMLKMLMEHAAGPRHIKATLRELQTLRSLRFRGLIYFNRLTRPTRTTANLQGRKVIAHLQTLAPLLIP
jgi:hypothetical protein